jgi:hypothetical protein
MLLVPASRIAGQVKFSTQSRPMSLSTDANDFPSTLTGDLRLLLDAEPGVHLALCRVTRCESLCLGNPNAVSGAAVPEAVVKRLTTKLNLGAGLPWRSENESQCSEIG